MWRRVIVAGLLFMVLASGGFWLTKGATGADSERVIPVRLMGESHESDDQDVGDTCAWHADFPRLMITRQQIIVKDENDTIIAAEDVEGVYEEGIFNGEIQCIVRLEMSVPDAKFYTVYIGDSRVVTYRADQFPIESLDELVIHF